VTDSPLSPEEIRAAAAAHHELGPDYSDAVVEAFLEKVDKELAARIEAHLTSAAPPRQRRATVVTRGQRSVSLNGVTLAAAGAAIPLVCLLILVHGSAAARADWSEWLTGTLGLIALIFVVGIRALKTRPVRQRLAR
jgi:hypothetical protein